MYEKMSFWKHRLLYFKNPQKKANFEKCNLLSMVSMACLKSVLYSLQNLVSETIRAQQQIFVCDITAQNQFCFDILCKICCVVDKLNHVINVI